MQNILRNLKRQCFIKYLLVVEICVILLPFKWRYSIVIYCSEIIRYLSLYVRFFLEILYEIYWFNMGFYKDKYLRSVNFFLLK